MKSGQTDIKVELLGVSNNPIAIIYSAFRICYSRISASELWQQINNGDISEQQMEDFIAEKLQTGHSSPLRQSHFIFVVDGISRAATAQFNRHHIGVEREEMSQRYVNFTKGIGAFVTPPSFKENPAILEEWTQLQQACINFYTKCTNAGIKQEDARFALPMATVSREQFAMNLQSMQNFLAVRMCERAQWEIRDMAWQMYRLMKKHHPILARTKLGIKCWENQNAFCDEDLQAYRKCRWSQSRPHKTDMINLWNQNKKQPDSLSNPS